MPTCPIGINFSKSIWGDGGCTNFVNINSFFSFWICWHWEIRFWSAESSEDILTITGPQGRINRVMWGPLNKTIISAGEDATVRIWDAEVFPKLLKSFSSLICDLDADCAWIFLWIQGYFFAGFKQINVSSSWIVGIHGHECALPFEKHNCSAL